MIALTLREIEAGEVDLAIPDLEQAEIGFQAERDVRRQGRVTVNIKDGNQLSLLARPPSFGLAALGDRVL